MQLATVGRDPQAAEPVRQGSRGLYLPTIAIAGLAAWLSWRGWQALGQYGVARSVDAGRFQLAGPVVLGFVLAVCVIEQICPAQRRPLLARGHLLDFCYTVFYALLVVPLIVLLGAGFSGLLARSAPWLVLPRMPGVPGWCFVALAVLGIDAVDWLTHLANHRLTALWRLHAVHHSQEELSILTTYRAHPLVHVSFLLSAIPVLAVEVQRRDPGRGLHRLRVPGRAAPRERALDLRAGRAGSSISPAYHRIHHSATGRLDINLGTIFAIWDVLSRRAVFPGPAARTRRSSRPAWRPAGPGRAVRAGGRAWSGPCWSSSPSPSPHHNGDAVTTTQSTRKPGQGTRGGLMWLLYICDAGLLVASGLIHLHLWDIAYRHVKTLDVLFLVQVVLCLLAALTLLVTRHLLVVVGAAALMAGTIVGFLLARTVGIFGFRLTFSSGLAYTVLAVEAAALVLLALTAWLPAGAARSAVST